MKKVSLLLALLVVLSIASAATKKGGLNPCLATCFLGSRVGVEMNEGTKIRTTEWIGLVGNFVFSPVGTLYMAIDPASGKTMNQIKREEGLGGPVITAPAPSEKGGPISFITSCCFGPRVALEANNGRNIRTMEWFTLIPLVNIIPVTYMCYEAYSGKTMSEIAASEGLDR